MTAVIADAKVATTAAVPTQFTPIITEGGTLCLENSLRVGEPEHAHVRWHYPLYHCLHSQPRPVFSRSGEKTTAAEIWVGARLCVSAFREMALTRGDRLILALPPSGSFIQVLIAALWEGLTIIPMPPPSSLNALGDAIIETDARCVIADSSLTKEIERTSVPLPFNGANPGSVACATRPRKARLARTPDTRFLLRTSGTSSPGGGRLIALSDRNLLSVLESHLPRLGLNEDKTHVLSVLPWHHSFGLVLDLLPALLSGAQISRVDSDSKGGDFINVIQNVGEATFATHMNTVPVIARNLSVTERGRCFLRSLKGGVVGGAPVDADLATFLSTTRLRAGYGQTEAGPGIALGEPGHWPGPGYLGKPLGCQTVCDKDDVLHFSGENACIGVWKPGFGLENLSPTRRVRTGDIVRMVDDDAGEPDLYFVARDDDDFKLSNGRRVEAGLWEARLIERFPFITDAMLHSPDGERLQIVFTSASGDALLPSLTEIAAALGSLGSKLSGMRSVPPAFWVRTPKGTRIRRACVEKLVSQAI